MEHSEWGINCTCVPSMQGNLEDIFKGVDLNQDGAVEFQEFATLVAVYAFSNYDALQVALKESEKKK